MQQVEEQKSKYEEIIDICHEKFKTTMLNRENRPKLDGKFIYIECKQWIENKAEMFWHISSLAQNEKFNIYPCNNHQAYRLCNKNCIEYSRQVTVGNNEVRNVCLYRCMMVNLVSEVIEMANNKDLRIKRWIKDNKTHLWFEDNNISYIVILKNKNEKYALITAFPVFYISSIDNFNRDFQIYGIK